MPQQVTHWKKLQNPDYIGAYALQPGEEIIATIKSVGLEMVMGTDGKKEECTVARFQERDLKPMVLNSTNCKTITKIYKTPYIEAWAGKRIQLYIAQVKAFGEVVDALRIRPFVPDKALPVLTPEHEKWSGAVAAIREGRNSIEGVKKYFTLSPENEQLLTEEAANA